MRTLVKAMSYLLAPMLLWLAPAQAAIIVGTVAELGKSVTEAEITLVNADNSTIIKSVYSTADGSFRFTVKPGTYNVGVVKPGYVAVWNKGIAVNDSDVTLSIELVDKAFADGPPKAAGGDCE